jgi:hypothetical protein
MHSSYLPLLTGSILVAAIIGLGAWLTVKKRYHIFYLSLSGLFVLNIVLYVFSFFSAVDSMMGSGYETQGDDASASSGGFNVGFDFLQFLFISGVGLFFLVSILSVVNLFIRKNKLAVKIVSVIMILFSCLIGYVINLMAHWGKVGG